MGCCVRTTRKNGEEPTEAILTEKKKDPKEAKAQLMNCFTCLLISRKIGNSDCLA